MNGICKYCGQYIMTVDIPDGSSEEEQLYAGTMNCSCGDARDYRERLSNIEEAKQKIEDIVKRVDFDHNIDGIDEQTIERLKENVDLLVDGKVKGVAFDLDKLGTIKISAAALGKVTVEREIKLKEKA